MNIYLAGKMCPEKGSWRNHILGTECVYAKDGKTFADGKRHRQQPRWLLVLEEDEWGGDWRDDQQCLVRPWPVRDRIVLGQHAYVGPYRQELSQDFEAKYLGWWHGAETFGQHGQMGHDEQKRIVSEARQGIHRCDMLFAYINDPEAWGTVAEIGYALALGKYVHLLINETEVFSEEEFWFLSEMANGSKSGRVRESPDGWGAETERDLVRDALKDAIVAFAAWQGPARPEPSGEPTSRAAAEAFDSFRQISQWTSDPRVRGEADRMVRFLAREAGLGVKR